MQLVGLWVANVFFDKEVPYDGPSVEGVAMVNGHS